MLRRDTLRFTGLAYAALASAPLVAASAPAARAAFVDAPDVVVFCDPALRGAMRRVGAMFRSSTGVPIRVICAPGRVMAAQLVCNERDDIFISLTGVVEQLASSGIARPQAAAGVWRNRLVIARVGPGPAAVAPDRLPALLADRKLGAPDPSVNAVVDTPALIRTLGLEQALAGRIAGEVDTGGVAWMLARGQVGLGLILTTDARSGGFSTAVDIPDQAYPAIRYTAAFSKHVLSRNASAFMQFLATGPARASLAASGLEVGT